MQTLLEHDISSIHKVGYCDVMIKVQQFIHGFDTATIVTEMNDLSCGVTSYLEAFLASPPRRLLGSRHVDDRHNIAHLTTTHRHA